MAEGQATRAGHAGERARADQTHPPGRHPPMNRDKATASLRSHFSQFLILRISSASTHSARFRFTLRSMLPTVRVCIRRPCTLRPRCPP